ncbi:MAG: ThiF family adenylyltransferase [Phycisphaerales bacterium]
MSSTHEQPAESRYHRQELLPGIGPEGQRRLRDGHALIVGCGALGCVCADLLARAGVGRLTLVDRDVVETTNLQRQTLFDERDARAGTPKAEAARSRLIAVNSEVKVEAIVEDFAPGNAEQIVRPHPAPGVLIDGTDNFDTRYLLNDLSVKLGLPLVYGGALGTGGMVMTIIPAPLPAATPCLRCLFPEPPAPGSAPTCDTAGVLASATVTVGAAQAVNAIKVLTGQPETLDRAIESFDLWTNDRRRIDVGTARRKDCPCCGLRQFTSLEGDYGGASVVLCGRRSVQITPSRPGGSPLRLDLAELATRLMGHGETSHDTHTLRCALPGGRLLTVFRDGRAIIGGTTDPAVARSVYARYVGA